MSCAVSPAAVDIVAKVCALGGSAAKAGAGLTRGNPCAASSMVRPIIQLKMVFIRVPFYGCEFVTGFLSLAVPAKLQSPRIDLDFARSGGAPPTNDWKRCRD